MQYIDRESGKANIKPYSAGSRKAPSLTCLYLEPTLLLLVGTEHNAAHTCRHGAEERRRAGAELCTAGRRVPESVVEVDKDDNQSGVRALRPT